MFRKTLSLLAALAFLLSVFAFTAGSAHAATSSPRGPGPDPNCQTSQITDLHQNHFYFRTHITCSASSSRIASVATGQYDIPSHGDGWSDTGVSTRSECSYCNALLNPSSGGLAVVDTARFPAGTCFRVYETIFKR